MQRAFLVNAHQPTVAGDVTREDRCKLALNVILDHAGFPSRAKPYFPDERYPRIIEI
jgi:hypothetical protein